MLFNRFLTVNFLDAGKVIGGRQEFVNGHITIPPTIDIDCEHSNESTPNEATIRILNAHPDTQKALFQEGKRVEVEAGYWPQDGERYTAVIFKGKIRSVRTYFDGNVDVVSELEFGDGDDAARVRKSRRTYPSRTSQKKIVDDVVSDMVPDGVTRGIIDVLDYIEPRAITIDRPSWRVLDDIAHQHGLMWSIQDGVLNMTPADLPLKTQTIILSPQHGLLDAPTVTDDGIEIRTLMLPYLRPGMTFELRNAFKNNRAPEKYRIENVSFMGSNVGDTFGAEIKAKLILPNGKVKQKRARNRKKKA